MSRPCPMPIGRRFDPPVSSEEFLRVWDDFRAWQEEEYIGLRALGIENDYDMSKINGPVDLSDLTEECPGCGSYMTAFDKSLKSRMVLNARCWTCTECGLMFGHTNIHEHDTFVPW